MQVRLQPDALGPIHNAAPTAKKKGGGFAPPFVRGFRSGQRGFGLLRNLRKRRLVVHRQIGEHLAIDVDRGLAQSVDERAVCHAELAHGGVDPRDPQRAEFALLRPPVAVLVLAGLHHGFLGDPVDVVPAAAETLRLFENLLVPRAGGHTTFYSWHGRSLRVRKHRGDGSGIRRMHFGRTAQMPLVLGRLLGEDVALERLRALHRTASAHAEALLRARLGLHLRHDAVPLFAAHRGALGRSGCGRRGFVAFRLTGFGLVRVMRLR